MLQKILMAAGAVVILLLAVGGIAYATDYGVEADVVSKTTPCRIAGGNEVTVKTGLFGIEATVPDIPYEQCLAVNPGNHVVYHLRSGRTSLYESKGGPCIYDSEGGIRGC